MKLDIRDWLWLLIALILLGLLGLEWRREHLLAEEIRTLSAAEAPLELVNAQFDNARMFIWSRYRVECKVDWPSLKPLGLNSRTPVTRSIQADTAREAYEQLFGDKVKIIDTPTGLRAQAR